MLMGSEAVAIGADDVAYIDLGQDALHARTSDHRHDVLDLRRRVAVIELHRTGRVCSAAIEAWHVTKLVKHVGVPAPAGPDPIDVWTCRG